MLGIETAPVGSLPSEGVRVAASRPSRLSVQLGACEAKLAVRRTLSFLFASAILLAGLALSIFEIIQAQNLRPFVLFGALVMLVASGAWLLYDHR